MVQKQKVHIHFFSKWPQNRKNLCQAPQTGPRWTLIAPKLLLVGLVTQTDWINVITVCILIILKICGSSKTNNLSFDQNHLIKNPILSLLPYITKKWYCIQNLRMNLSFQEKKTILKSDTWLPRYQGKTQSNSFLDNL